MCLMVMKHTIPMTIKGSMPDKVSAKNFLTEITCQFTKLNKVEASAHLSKLVNMSYNKKRNIKGYIIEMSDLVSKLKTRNWNSLKRFWCTSFLFSLPPQYNYFQD